MSNVYAHDAWLEANTELTEDEQKELLSIVDDAVLTGVRLAQSLEFQAVKHDYGKVWDLIDEKKLR